MFIQSFELTNLMDLRTTFRVKTKLVFLTGASGAPFDLASTGDPRSYADLTTPVADAHAAGLLVHPYTFRAENQFLPTDYRRGPNPADYGRILDEITAYLSTGIDGFFTDQADIGVFARDTFVRPS